MKRFFVLAVWMSCVGSVCAGERALPPMIRPAAMSGVFIEGVSPVFVPPEGFGALEWKVLDWNRTEVCAGCWPAQEKLTLAPLPKGYYYLEAKEGDRKIRVCTFCVVPDPKTRTYPSDSFYGVDAALSSLARPEYTALKWYDGEDCAAATLELIRLCGLPHVRERMSWPRAEPKPGKYEWGKYARNVRSARERGLRLLGMFHSVAPHAGSDPKTPTDMKAVYDFCRAYGEMGGGTMAGWEFWNEEDVSGFWTDTCWNYVAAMKAAYLGYKAANPSTPVLNGAICQEKRNDFDEIMFRNDLAKYCDVFGFHLYIAPAAYPKYFADLNAFLRRQGLDDRARWITESSNNVEGDAADGGLLPHLKAHSRAQELAVAETYAKYRIVLQMNGVSRDYFFVFGAYNEREGTKDWGVQRRDGSVKPLYAAISATTENLVAARLVGEKKVGEGIRCFVFAQPDGAQSVVYWSVSPCDRTHGSVRDLEKSQDDRLPRKFRLAAASGEYRGSNWCGTPFGVRADGEGLELEAERYAKFLNGFHGLSVDDPARPRGRIGARPPADGEDLTVVIRAEFNPEDFDIADNKTTAELRAGRDSGRVAIHIWNLSDAAKDGRLEFRNARAENVPDALRLPAWGHVRVDARMGLSDPKAVMSDTEIGGIFGGRRMTKTVIPMRNEDRFVAGCEVVDAGANRPDFWTINDSAPEHRISWDEGEKAVRFDLRWTDPNADRWFYPVHMFARGKDPATLDGTTMIEFEARLEQDKVENDVSVPVLMPVTPPGSSLNLLWVKWTPPTRQWQKIRIPLINRDGTPSCNGASGFRLGFKPRGKVVTYWIRNLAYVRPRQVQEKNR